jgi:hypothetical protein
MPTRLESLRVEADLNAAKYVAGAQAKAAADQKMIDSAKAVDAATETTQRKLGDSATAVDRLARSLDPAIKMQANMERAQGTLTRALEQGRITQTQYNDLLEKARQRYTLLPPEANNAAGAITGVGLASKLTFTQMQILQSGVINTVQSLAAGMSPIRTFQTQLLQTAPAFPALARALTGTQIAAAATVGTLAILGGAFIAVAAHASTLDAEARQFSVSIRAMGRDAEISASQMQGWVKQLRDAGIAAAEAKAAVQAAVRTPGVSTASIQSSVAAAPNFAAAYGLNIGDATKQLVQMGAEGYTAIKKLDDAYNFLSPDQARHIRQLAEAGDKAGALAGAYEALMTRTKDASRDSMTEIDKRVKDLNRSFSDLWDTVARGAIGQISLRMATAAADTIAHPSTILNGPIGTVVNPAVSAYRTLLGNPTQYLASLLTGGKIANPYATPRTSPGGGPGPSVPFGGVVATPPGGAGGGGSGPDSASLPGIKYVQDQTDAYDRQKQVLQASIGVREIVNARIQAEDEATKNGLQGKQRDELITLRQSQARDKLAQAAKDSLTVMRAETEGLLGVADAYTRSMAAGKAAEAAAQAHSEKIKNDAVDEKALATAIRDRAAAQQLVDISKQANDLKFQADMQEKAVEAARHGAEASQEAARQAEVEGVRRQALSVATDGTVVALMKAVDAYDEESKRRLKAQQEIQHEAAIRQAANDNQIAAMQARAAQLTDATETNAAQIAIARQQKINELTEQYGTVAEGTGKKLLEMWDQSALSRDQARYWNDVKNKAQEISGDIQQFLVDGFVNAEKGGQSAFKNLWDGALAGGKRMIANLIASIATQKIILPMVMPIVGGLSSAFGIASAAGGVSGSAGGGMSLLGTGSNLLSLGQGAGLFGGAGLGLSGAIDSFGASIGFGGVEAAAPSAAFIGPMPATSGILGTTSLSQLLGGVGMGFAAGSLLNGLIGGNQAQGMVGSGIGALGGAIIGSIVPGIGTLIGGLIGGAGGGVLGGLFGPGKSVGPIGSANFNVSNGQLVRGATGVDNGGDLGAITKAGDTLVQTLNALNQSLGLTLTGSGFLTSIGFGQAPGPHTSEEVVRAIYGSGRVQSGNATLDAALGKYFADPTKTAGLNADQITAAVSDFVNTFNLLDAEPKKVDALGNALKAVNDQFDALGQKAKDYGISVGNLEDQRQKAIAGTVKAYNANIQSFLDQINFGTSSPLSPTTILSGQAGQYAAVLAQAQAGDETARQSVTTAAASYLNAARSAFASGTGFFDVYNRVKADLEALLKAAPPTPSATALGGIDPGSIRVGDLPGFATGGSFTVGGFGGTDSQLIRFRATPGERVTITTPANDSGSDTVRLLAATNAEIRALRATVTSQAKVQAETLSALRRVMAKVS